MNATQKGILANGIIIVLNEHLEKENKRLCALNLHSEQKPLHGADMLFRLAYMEEAELNKVASACGL